MTLENDHPVHAIPAQRGWLSSEDLAERLGLSLRTVYRWAQLGDGPPKHRFGRSVRYRLADVEEWEGGRRVAE